VTQLKGLKSYVSACFDRCNAATFEICCTQVETDRQTNRQTDKPTNRQTERLYSYVATITMSHMHAEG